MQSFSVLVLPFFRPILEAKRIMNNHPDIIEGANRIAGKDMYTDGSLIAKSLASLIFNNEELLTKVIAWFILLLSDISWNGQIIRTLYVIIEA